ncbi:hypothetical protein ABZ345_43195 [Lentzea sp. NPDC005914]|uniref:hypothetical protein n=1 Tax=Lentzea sp. NPDC005914 TaxID=3154572 RepID=UPI0033F5173F
MNLPAAGGCSSGMASYGAGEVGAVVKPSDLSAVADGCGSGVASFRAHVVAAAASSPNLLTAPATAAPVTAAPATATAAPTTAHPSGMASC